MALTYIIPAAAVIVIGVIADYFILPFWSIHNPFIYLFLIVLACLYFGIHQYMCRLKKTSRVLGSAISLGIAAALLAILFIGALTSWSIFHAKAYANILGNDLVECEITNLVISLEDAGLLDKETAEQLALREMGSLTDLVSQFDVQSSTQITYNGAPTRVMPLDYADPIKSFTNRKNGVPAYITVDMRTQEADIHYIDQPIKYTPNAIFGKDLMRHLHYLYPTRIFAQAPQFEIDDSGNPFYVVPVEAPTISLFGGSDVVGVITVDPCSGAAEYYELGTIPEWIDRAYPADMIIEQFDNYGKFQGGFWNSFLGQKGVVASTDGYNYVSDSYDTYMYTGVTSVTADESNIGFLFSNLRTKETRYYPLAGAEEYSAMATAEEAVKNFGYTASFPWMLIVEGTPTYCMTLKGDGGIVYMYAMVNVNKYQLVATGTTKEECQSNYRNLVLSNDVTITQPNTSTPNSLQAGNITGRIEDIRTGNKNGTTYFYLKLEDREPWYVISLIDNEEAIKLNTTDTVVLDAGASGGTGPIIQAKLRSYTEGAQWWDNN